MQIRSEYAGGFSFNSAREMYNAYVDDLYKFDQAYRLFSEKVNFTLSKGWEILRGLKEEVENLYINWYLHELGLAWDQHLEEENLLESNKLEETKETTSKEAVEKKSSDKIKEVKAEKLEKISKDKK